MFTKEECLKMADKLEYLIPIKDEYGYGCSMCEFDEMVLFVNLLINEYFEPQPYRFEDLEPNMWAWDNLNKRCLKIKEIARDKLGRIVVRYCSGYGNDNIFYELEFEENRLFPVWMANLKEFSNE